MWQSVGLLALFLVPSIVVHILYKQSLTTSSSLLDGSFSGAQSVLSTTRSLILVYMAVYNSEIHC